MFLFSTSFRYNQGIIRIIDVYGLNGMPMTPYFKEIGNPMQLANLGIGDNYEYKFRVVVEQDVRLYRAFNLHLGRYHVRDSTGIVMQSFLDSNIDERYTTSRQPYAKQLRCLLSLLAIDIGDGNYIYMNEIEPEPALLTE